MKKFTMLMLLLCISFLTSCNNQSTRCTETQWHEIYAAVLREYLYEDGHLFFVLHDFDLDGIPELIIIGEINNEIIDVVYTIRNGYALQLTFDEDVYIAGFALSARAGIAVLPNGIPGLLTYVVGASSLFGSNRIYNHIVINEGHISLNVRGATIIDVKALHTINENIDGIIHTDEIKQHTQWLFDEDAVSMDDFNQLFGYVAPITILAINENNIHTVLDIR